MESVNKSLGASVFLTTFGNYPINRVLDFLVVFSDFDYSIADIARKSGVGYSTLKLLIHDLAKRKMVVPSRTVGRAKLFRLNRENLTVKRFVQFYWDITNRKIEQEHAPSGKKAPRMVA